MEITTMATDDKNNFGERKQKLLDDAIDAQSKNEISLVLVGKSGHGKSSFGNTICGYHAFPVNSLASSQIKRCAMASRNFDGKDLIVIDTPGVFDTDTNFTTIKAHLQHAVAITMSGPNAFLIVIPSGRYTDEEQQTIQLIKDTFGPDASKFCILIFTKEDDLLFHEETIEDHIKSSKKLEELVAQCQNRYLAVNNRASREERDDKVRQLIAIVQTMMKSNQQQHYTNEDLKKAEKILRKRTEEEMIKKLEAEEILKQAVREECKRDIQDQYQALQDQKRLLERDIIKYRDAQREAIAEQTASGTMQSVLNFLQEVIPPVVQSIANVVSNAMTSDHGSVNDVTLQNHRVVTSPSITGDTLSDREFIESMRLPRFNRLPLPDIPDLPK